MKVILRKDINTLGRPGEVKTVKDGYARNYLLPKGLAEEATEGALRNWKLGEERRAKRQEKEITEAKAVAEKISAMTLSYTRAVGETGQLFGSVGKADICKSLEAGGIEIDKESVNLLSPIKAIGDTAVVINLKPGVSAEVKVRVAAKAD